MTWKTGSSSHSWPIVRRSGGLSKQGPGGERRGRLTDLIPCEGLTALGMSDQGLSLNHPGSAVLSLSLKRKALRSERVVSCLCALETCAHYGRQVALVSRGATPQIPPGSYLGFRVDPELGPESPATSEGGDIWGLTWARATTGRWGRRETSGSETNRQLIPELTPHLPGRQTTGPAHPQGQAAALPPTSQAAQCAIHFKAQARLQGHFETVRSPSLHFLKHDPHP
jgi:hypothetical protein